MALYVVWQSSKFSEEVIQDNMELLLEYLSPRAKWEPVNKFLRLGGATLLLQLVAMASEWNAYTGKSVPPAGLSVTRFIFLV